MSSNFIFSKFFDDYWKPTVAQETDKQQESILARLERHEKMIQELQQENKQLKTMVKEQAGKIRKLMKDSSEEKEEENEDEWSAISALEFGKRKAIILRERSISQFY